MEDNEKRLSDYIDTLNNEKTPNGHKTITDSVELEKVFDTVRKVKSLKEASMPENNYPEKLAKAVQNRLSHQKSIKKRKQVWFSGIASVAAIVAIAIMINFTLPFGSTNIVYAMEQAYQEIEAYHGILEIIQTNGENQKSTQSKLEVWAAKDGQYFVKGLEGWQKDLTTINNGEKKWQVRPNENQVHVFPAFPDGYRFVFELGNEIDDIKNALSTKIIGNDVVAGREATILEVSPQGSIPYRIWIDKETNLPLQKQSGMIKGIQYTITYTEIDFSQEIPQNLLAYQVPDDFIEVNKNAEQVVNNLEEVQTAIGFIPEVIDTYPLKQIAIVPETELVKLYYDIEENGKKVVVIQGKSASEFKPAPTAILGKIGANAAEVQSPVYEDLGILGGGQYAGITDINSIRWYNAGFEYAVVGDPSLDELISFTENLTDESVVIPESVTEHSSKPQVEVEVDLAVEETEQKSVDSGSSPWRLDPVYVTQVFVSLEIYPEGITGEYPINIEELKIIENTGSDAIVEVSGDETTIKKVYLKKLIRQDPTGIWTVVGYDPV